jgi:AP-2 complex subunit alpha
MPFSFAAGIMYFFLANLKHKNVLDCELQQRACEFVALASLPSDELLQTVFEPVPAFPERESAVIQRLKKQVEGSDEKKPSPRIESDNKDKAVSRNTDLVALGTEAKPAGLMDDLLGLVDTGAAVTAVPKEKIESWYIALLLAPSGIFYEDQEIQVGVKTEYSTFNGKLALYFGNKTGLTMQNFSVVVQPAAGLQIGLTSNPSNAIAAKSQFVQTYQLISNSPFAAFSHIAISFNLEGRNRSIPDLKLPVQGTKFSEPIAMKGEDFIGKWKQIGGGPKESQEVFKSTVFTQPPEVKNLLAQLNIGVIEGVDQNPANICGASVLHSQTAKVGNLLRIETNAAQEVVLFSVLLMFLDVPCYSERHKRCLRNSFQRFIENFIDEVNKIILVLRICSFPYIRRRRINGYSSVQGEILTLRFNHSLKK